MSSPLKNNTTSLQDLLNTVNALPEAGVELPELTNEGSASDMLSGKQLIDSDGNVVTGTIATKTSSNLTASGATVTVPAGYYASQATKSVATATQATPSISVNSSGLITASATQTAGYVTAGTKTGTKQLTTQAAKTITPTKSSQTAVAKDVYTTGAVTVAAIPSQYITTTDATASADEIMSGETAYVNGSKVTGTFSIDSELNTQDSLISQIQTALAGKAAGGAEPTLQEKTVTPNTSSQTVTPDSNYDGLSKVTVNAIPSTYIKPTTTKAATTYTPSTSNQTIAAGTYCSGVQTIKGDANLKAENIAEGISIFGITGTHNGGSSGGGGNVETCTVTITKDSNFDIYGIHYTAFINNKITSLYEIFNTAPTSGIVLNDVICNSSISINAYLESFIAGFTINGTAQCQEYQNSNKIYYFKAPSVSGENCSIYMYDDD